MLDPAFIQLYIFLFLIILGYVTGTIIEKNHFRTLRALEKHYISLPAVTIENALVEGKKIASATLVTGNAVISLDYFKRFLAALYNFFGGEVRSYESLIDRARREALIRMKKQALTADIILNVRIETSTIGKSADQRKTIGSIEAVAYGTAVTYSK